MTSFRSGPSSHALMVGGAVCPTCEQPIPHEQAQKVWERFKAQGETLAKAQIEKVQSESASAIEKVKAESIAQQTAARSAGIKEAQAAAQEKLAEAERQKKEALERVENFEVNMELAINQVREVKYTDLNAIRAEHFKDTLKWKDKVQSLERSLDQKNAQELGEGAEVNLFEALKAEYPADHIERVPKGAAGADIIQVVKHNGKACGKIVYDSKNRKAWRDDYVTKLREDQIAAKAEHAVLSTCKLPAGAQQVAVHAGVIIANPARVVTLAWILRREIIQTSSLRIVGNQRDGKTAALYAYITSDRFRQQLGSIDECIAKLRGIDAAERKDHDAVWKKRGRLIESLGYDDIRAETERIIGTAEDSDDLDSD